MTSLPVGLTRQDDLGHCHWCRALGRDVKPVTVIITGSLATMSTEAYAYCAEHRAFIVSAFDKDQLFMRPNWTKVDEILVGDL